MTWQWPSAVFLCSKVSCGILPIWGTNKRSGGWEEVLASFPWLDCPLPRSPFLLGDPLCESTFSKFFYYSCSFFFFFFQAKNIAWSHNLLVPHHCIFPPMYLAHTFENGPFIRLTSICLILTSSVSWEITIDNDSFWDYWTKVRVIQRNWKWM